MPQTHLLKSLACERAETADHAPFLVGSIVSSLTDNRPLKARRTPLLATGPATRYVRAMTARRAHLALGLHPAMRARRAHLAVALHPATRAGTAATTIVHEPAMRAGSAETTAMAEPAMRAGTAETTITFLEFAMRAGNHASGPAANWAVSA